MYMRQICIFLVLGRKPSIRTDAGDKELSTEYVCTYLIFSVKNVQWQVFPIKF